MLREKWANSLEKMVEKMKDTNGRIKAKIVLLGDPYIRDIVFYRFTQERYNINYKSGMSDDSLVYKEYTHNKLVVISGKFWVANRQYRCLMGDTDAIIVLFDMSSSSTFSNACNILGELCSRDNKIIALAGIHECDYKCVAEVDIKEALAKYNINIFEEIYPKTGENVSLLFEKVHLAVIQECLDKMEFSVASAENTDSGTARYVLTMRR